MATSWRKRRCSGVLVPGVSFGGERDGVVGVLVRAFFGGERGGVCGVPVKSVGVGSALCAACMIDGGDASLYVSVGGVESIDAPILKAGAELISEEPKGASPRITLSLTLSTRVKAAIM